MLFTALAVSTLALASSTIAAPTAPSDVDNPLVQERQTLAPRPETFVTKVRGIPIPDVSNIILPSDESKLGSNTSPSAVSKAGLAQEASEVRRGGWLGGFVSGLKLCGGPCIWDDNYHPSVRRDQPEIRQRDWLGGLLAGIFDGGPDNSGEEMPNGSYPPSCWGC